MQLPQNEVWPGIRRLEQFEDITHPCFSSKSWPTRTAKNKQGVRESSAKDLFGRRWRFADERIYNNPHIHAPSFSMDDCCSRKGWGLMSLSSKGAHQWAVIFRIGLAATWQPWALWSTRKFYHCQLPLPGRFQPPLSHNKIDRRSMWHWVTGGVP